ncbi:MAG: hypothetical protein H7A23_19815 [Leptospiraceae bacterium]|nr:hypothetical protein [Leptospiraceae bacterium]
MISDRADHTEIIEELSKNSIPRWMVCRVFSVARVFRPEEKVILQVLCLKPTDSCEIQIYQGYDNLV